MKTLVTSLFLVGLLSFFAGCSSSDDEGPKPDGSGLKFLVDHDTILITGLDKATFTVTFDGIDVTAKSKILEINTKLFLKNGVFTATKVGTYTFVAEYNGQNTTELKVEAIPERLFLKNILLTQFTSMQCQACPNMSVALVNIVQQEERFKIMSVHGVLGEDKEPKEEFVTKDILNPLYTTFSIAGFPTVLINQQEKKTSFLELKDLEVLLKERGDVGIALNTKLEGTNATIEVRVKAACDFENPCALAVYILEDGLEAPQLWQKSPTNIELVPNYKHNNITRKKLTNVFGDKQEIGKDKELVKNYTLTVPVDYPNRRGMYVMAYVVDSKTNRVLNCQKVRLNESIAYQPVDFIPEGNN